MGILFTILIGFLFTITMGILFTMVLGIQFTISRGEQLLYISDAVLHPIHLEQPEWYAAVDFAPEQVVATRHRLLNRAAGEKALVLAFHFPFPGLGHVIQKEEAWQWQPIETTD